MNNIVMTAPRTHTILPPTRYNLQPIRSTPEGAGPSRDEQKHAHELLCNRLLCLDHIWTMGILQEHVLGPKGDNNNHLSRWEYTEDAPAGRFKRVETAERDKYKQRRCISLGIGNMYV